MAPVSSAPDAWERLAPMRLRLQPSVRFERHAYRGEPWVVAHDVASGSSLRLSPEAHRIVEYCDGSRTLREIADTLGIEVDAASPERAELVAAVNALLASELLHTDSPSGLAQMLLRKRSRSRARLLAWLRSPLAFRIRLLDPDAFLERTLPSVRWFFTPRGAALWLCLVGLALLAGFMHWEELTHDITDRVLAAPNMLLLGLVFPIVKAIHELGHAYAVKVWGGEVHEMGVMLIVFVPVPYVDASAASAFPEKSRRALVGAAGVGVELVVASLALLAWINLEPGLVRAIAFNAIVIAGVSTLLFNANPLLRFDGYYVFADAVEIPNLGPRSIRYIGHLIHRHLFGVREQEPPVSGRRERFWLASYAVASFAYRMVVLFGIILFIATKYFFVGVLLAIWATLGLIALPLARQIRRLLRDPRLGDQRPRALSVSLGGTALLVSALLLVPAPMRTVAEGVVWLPQDALVRAGVDGFAVELLAEPGRIVAPGDALLRLRSPELDAQERTLAAQLREEEIRHAAQQVDDLSQAELTREAVGYLRDRVRRIREQQQELVVRSPAAGRFVVERPADLEGRFVQRGDPVGYVVAEGPVTARVVVDADRVDLVRGSTREIHVRLAEHLGDVLAARLGRELPAASQELPSVALGLAGGGEVALDPTDPLALRSFERLFHFELELEAQGRAVSWGQRVHVRFDHEALPLARQWYRSLRQLFLTRLHV